MASSYDGYYDEDGNWHDPAASPDVNEGPPADYPDSPLTPPGGNIAAPLGPADPAQPPPTNTPAPAPAPAPSGGGQFNGSFNAPAWMDIGDAPQPDLPTWTPPPAFHFNAPTPDSIKSNQAYQFRTNSGLDALQRWAAYKGTVNDSGTANALIDYAGNSASQEYDNIYNRDWQTQRGEYDTNYNTQYVDPYKFNYQRGLDMNAPRVQTWQEQSANTRARNDWAQREAWDGFMREYDQWKFNAGNDLAG